MAEQNDKILFIFFNKVTLIQHAFFYSWFLELAWSDRFFIVSTVAFDQDFLVIVKSLLSLQSAWKGLDYCITFRKWDFA